MVRYVQDTGLYMVTRNEDFLR